MSIVSETADLVVNVDLAGFTSSSFSAVTQIIPKGFEGAEKKSPLLQRLALTEDDGKNIWPSANPPPARDSPSRIYQVSGVEPPFVRDREIPQEQHRRPLDTAALEKNLDLLSGSGRFTPFLL